MARTNLLPLIASGQYLVDGRKSFVQPLDEKKLSTKQH